MRSAHHRRAQQSGRDYRVLGRLDEAEPLYERAVVLDERNLGADDPGLATSLNNLALLYRSQNRLAEAEQLYERSLDILENIYGPHHPNVAKSLNNLAVQCFTTCRAIASEHAP
ncbi:MAG: tetratricopeptide repeat protein [Geminicoccaceae bacterium]